eukprot:CAMPEP_0173391936 /NCGR_PEP_ID=MMETSP1356-20130122/18671_1 /TAXON_ID=77927 ORGANISM="Hemiselmis virescens, Strain PCC157" /NCGR_SAMPLE_ID=MMETSP1356 /ASSEMBLY_ACC=CAM_ASM_000847 /LENGTH=68 /DNA_ID=CAMNT_0014349639 /DNA_START=103 /DNA_END=306 /DNA_ORIENTATION=+
MAAALCILCSSLVSRFLSALSLFCAMASFWSISEIRLSRGLSSASSAATSPSSSFSALAVCAVVKYGD